MYRQYEDPRALTERLHEAEKAYEEAKAADPDGENIDLLIDLANEVESLRERVNFAWQDEEYDETHSS